MNKEQLKQFVASHDLYWQAIFINYHLAYYPKLRDCNEDATVSCMKCIDNATTPKELDEIEKSIKMVNDNYKKITTLIYHLLNLRPVYWQIDLLKTVKNAFALDFPLSLDENVVLAVICIAIRKFGDNIYPIIEFIDQRYNQKMEYLNEKTDLTKQILLQSLENDYGKMSNRPLKELTFREIINMYVHKVGYQNVLDKVIFSQNQSDTILNPDDWLLINNTYYTLGFNDTKNLEENTSLLGSITTTVNNQLDGLAETYKKYEEAHQKKLSFPDQSTFYIDPRKKCILNVHVSENMYGHIYILQDKHFSIKHSYTDYVVNHKGFLYTIEFVNSFKEFQQLNGFTLFIEGLNKELERVTAQIMTSSISAHNYQSLVEYKETLKKKIKAYYCIYY